MIFVMNGWLKLKTPDEVVSLQRLLGKGIITRGKGNGRSGYWSPTQSSKVAQ